MKKRILVFVSAFLLMVVFISGCATWHGIKKDTKKIVHVMES